MVIEIIVKVKSAKYFEEIFVLILFREVVVFFVFYIWIHRLKIG